LGGEEMGRLIQGDDKEAGFEKRNFLQLKYVI
jgi:hypothetical protein